MGVAVAGSRDSSRAGEISRPHLYLVPTAPVAAIPRQRPPVRSAAATPAVHVAAGCADAVGCADAAERAAAIRAVRPQPIRAARPQPIRLTRRGRVVVVLFLLGLMVGVAVLLSSTSQASAPAGPARTIVVHPGDTLWSISVAALPEVNPDAAVERVRQLNHKNDNTIYVGEELTLPPTR